MKKLTTIFIAILSLYSCKQQEQSSEFIYMSIWGFTQGTNYNITYALPDSVDLQFEVDSLLAEFDTSLSTYNKASIISKVNRNEDIKLDARFINVFERAHEISESTGGAFDITAAPIIGAWGFGSERKTEVSQHLIDSVKEFIGHNKIKLDNGIITKEDPRITLNVNAIAQGYAVDVVAEYLEMNGVNNYLVEIGGEVKAKGKNNKGNDWRIGIDKPVDNNNIPGSNLQVIVSLTNKSLATSGNYRKFYEKDGIKYSHTINPATGYPVSHSLLSATIIADECMTADAIATSFMVMGLEKSKEYLNSHPELQAYLIYSDEKGEFKVYYSPSLEESIKEL